VWNSWESDFTEEEFVKLVSNEKRGGEHQGRVDSLLVLGITKKRKRGEGGECSDSAFC